MEKSTIMQEVADLVTGKDFQQETYIKEAQETFDAFMTKYPFLMSKDIMESDQFMELYKATEGTSRAKDKGYISICWILEETEQKSVMFSSSIAGFNLVYDMEKTNGKSRPCVLKLSRKKYKNLEKQVHFFIYTQQMFHTVSEKLDDVSSGMPPELKQLLKRLLG